MFSSFSNDSFAQGTIEYLVIVGVVVVISLVIVGLVINLTSSPSQQILSESDKLSSIGGGGIVITQAVSGDELGLIVLGNYSGGDVFLTRIGVDGDGYDYANEFIGSVGEIMVDVRDLCVCGKGEDKKTCLFEFFYLSKSGLEKKESKRVTVNCVSKVSVSGGSGGGVIKPIPKIVSDCFDDPQKNIGGINFTKICTLSDLNRVRDDLEGNYVLMNDIDASETREWNDGAGWEPIGDIYPFSGNFDGNNHKIINLYIHRPNESNVGLFKLSMFSSLKNIILFDINVSGKLNVGGLIGNCGFNCSVVDSFSNGVVSGKENNVGGLMGYNYVGDVNNCSFSGSVSGSGDNVGGIIGKNDEGGVDNCFFSGSVSGQGDYVGGLIGYNYKNNVNNSFSSGNIIGNNSYVGGLIGYNKGDIDNCSFSGSVSGEGEYIGGLVGGNNDGKISNSFTSNININGKKNTGGLVGYNQFALINDSFSNGIITGEENYIGGLIGQNQSGDVTNCFFDGEISGGENTIGGLIGNNFMGNINGCFSIGSVSGTTDVGGLVGGSNGTVTNSYSKSNSSGESNVGGLMGGNNGTITNSYSTGVVSGEGNNVGGLIGRKVSAQIIINSYWNEDTSNIGNSNGGEKKSNTEMMQKSTFVEWDIDYISGTSNSVWVINEGNDYPKLRWQME